MEFDSLSIQLWRQRRILEQMLFKLEVESLVLASGRHAWLERAVSEVKEVVGELRQAEVLRALSVADLALNLGLGAQPTFPELVEACPEPWDAIFGEHHKALSEIVEQIEQVSARIREGLVAGMESTAGALALLGVQPDSSYGADGARSFSNRQARLVNSAL